MRWNTEVQIGDHRVSITDPAYFIADIAANHDGDLERAKALIWKAKEAGADCAKFQHFLASKIVSRQGFESLTTQVAHQSGWKRSVVEVYDAYHTRRDWTETLVETCRAAGIDYMTTPYDREALEAQAPHIPAIKIGSGDITFHSLLRETSRIGKPVLLATGAATMEDIERAVQLVLEETSQLVLMQCNTNYSGSEDNFRHVNLRVLQTFALRWPGLPLGLSDHTPGHEAVLGAVTLGARVIEKHFTDDNDREGAGSCLCPQSGDVARHGLRHPPSGSGPGHRDQGDRGQRTGNRRGPAARGSPGRRPARRSPNPGGGSGMPAPLPRRCDRPARN